MIHNTEWVELMETRSESLRSIAVAGQMNILNNFPNLQQYSQPQCHFFDLTTGALWAILEQSMQDAFHFICTELDAANESDHPVAAAFVKRAVSMGFTKDMWKDTLTKYDKLQIEQAQQIKFKWAQHSLLELEDYVYFMTPVIMNFMESLITEQNQ